MSKRVLIGISALGVFLVTIVILVAVYVPGDNITRGLAVVGFVVALGKTVYDVWDKERERRKKAEDNIERLVVSPTFQPHDVDANVIGLRIHNAGKAAVSIRRVTLVYRNDGTEEAISLMTGTRHSGYDSTKRLESQEHTDFFAAAVPGGFVQPGLLEGLNAEDLWITVETLSGAKETITGEHLLRAMRRGAA